MTPLLSLHGLHKRFGEHTLFDIDAFVIERGSAYVLTGPNGSGKSTLLRILGGLETAETGPAAFDGKPVDFAHYPKELRDAIVYVHQHPVMFATSIADNVGYGLRLRKVPPHTCKKLVDEAMEWAGVAHLSDHRPDTLSGGEKQRIALARAKVLQPKLLLLDEPTSSLDGAAHEQVMALIPDLVRAGSTIIMAAHDQQLIRLTGVRRMDLRNGRMTFDKYRSTQRAIMADSQLASKQEDSMQLSARNQLEGIIRSIHEGPINSEVSIEVAPGVMIHAQISTASVKRLQLEVGKPAMAIIKTDSVMVGVE